MLRAITDTIGLRKDFQAAIGRSIEYLKSHGYTVSGGSWIDAQTEEAAICSAQANGPYCACDMIVMVKPRNGSWVGYYRNDII